MCKTHSAVAPVSTDDLFEDRLESKIKQILDPLSDGLLEARAASCVTASVAIDLGYDELPCDCPDHHGFVYRDAYWTCEKQPGQRGDDVDCAYWFTGFYCW